MSTIVASHRETVLGTKGRISVRQNWARHEHRCNDFLQGACAVTRADLRLEKVT